MPTQPEIWAQTTLPGGLQDPYSGYWQARGDEPGGAYRSLISVSDFDGGWESGDAIWVFRHHPEWILYEPDWSPSDSSTQPGDRSVAVRWSTKRFRENGSINPNFFRYYLDMTAGPALWEWIAMEYARVARTEGRDSFSLDNVALGSTRMAGKVKDLDAWNRSLIGCLRTVHDVGQRLGFKVNANTNCDYGTTRDDVWLGNAMRAVDGLMTEKPLGDDRTAEQWQLAMDYHDELIDNGVTDLWCVQAKTDEQQAKAFGYFASWLMVEGENKVFVVNQGYGKPAFNPPWLRLLHVLGKPVGEREKVAVGVWAREFEHGIVYVNPTGLDLTFMAGQSWSMFRPQYGYTRRGPVTVAAHSAAILACPFAWRADVQAAKRADGRA